MNKVGQDFNSTGHKYGHCAIDETRRQNKIARIFWIMAGAIYAGALIAVMVLS